MLVSESAQTRDVADEGLHIGLADQLHLVRIVGLDASNDVRSLPVDLDLIALRRTSPHQDEGTDLRLRHAVVLATGRLEHLALALPDERHTMQLGQSVLQ